MTYKKRLLLILMLTFKILNAQTDTINIMTYNVLNFGDVCQGNNYTMRSYLNTIISYSKPDILGLVKMQPIKRFPSDINGYLPIDFCDTIVEYALKPNNTINYAYCPFSNEARGSDINVLFYNEDKFGFIYAKVLTVKNTDFDLYKLYYKDVNLAKTNDTTFLFVALFHTESGDDPTTRNEQLTATYNALKLRFTEFPNLIFMGDYNLRNSSEIGYNQLVTASDTNYLLYDPPFSVDGNLSYPANWDKTANYASYMTTSTRKEANIPNACGTSGGAKGWYDHILFSNWVVNETNYMRYIPHSYQTIGNDGKRFGISINDSTTHGKNLSAPNKVINSLFELSNKYPIMAQFILKSNIKGVSPADPENPIASVNEIYFNEFFEMNNPIYNQLKLTLKNQTMNNQNWSMFIIDFSGKICCQFKNINFESSVQFNLETLKSGLYFLCLNNSKNETFRNKIIVYKE